MNPFATLMEFLLTVGLLVSPTALVLWLTRGADSVVSSPYGMRFDASWPLDREEIDPPRWRIELIGNGSVTSRRATEARVERPAFSGIR